MDLLVRVRVRVPELPVPGDVIAWRGLRHGDESHADDMPRTGAGIHAFAEEGDAVDDHRW